MFLVLTMVMWTPSTRADQTIIAIGNARTDGIMFSPYPVKMWNHHESTLNDDPRTNNFSKGSNNALNTAAGCFSPTMSRLMSILTKFTAETELKILQVSTGMQATRKSRNKVVKRSERIKKTVEGYSLSKIALYFVLQIPGSS